jgi:hypothetical protein
MAHAVALIPGFLGFDHRGERTYFADRFIAGLRARLEQRCGETIPVVPVSTLPIGSLQARQQNLIGELKNLGPKLGNPTWHLVGHSTGGLDAVLLSCTKQLEYVPGHGSRFSGNPLTAPALGSVTTISAPLWGTCLALSPVAQLTQGNDVGGGALALVRTLPALLQRDSLLSRAEFALGGAAASGPGSLLHMMLNNELACDLQPAVAGALMQAADLKGGLGRFSVATMAPPLTAGVSDQFFRDLWTWTSQQSDAAPLPAKAFPDPATLNVIRNEAKQPLPARVTAADNDGVVNTLRQVHGTLLALVIGDHGDVIGRYRRDDLLDGHSIDPGLLTSGASFEDDQFFEFLGALSKGIGETIRA